MRQQEKSLAGGRGRCNGGSPGIRVQHAAAAPAFDGLVRQHLEARNLTERIDHDGQGDHEAGSLGGEGRCRAVRDTGDRLFELQLFFDR